MGFSLVPREWYESVLSLDGVKLRARGITLLLLDLDNTIAPYGTTVPSAELQDWVAQLRAAGVEPYILSNSRKPTRVQEFAGALGVSYRRHAGKPKSGGFYVALEETGRTAAQAAMAGDQIFTDILGANRVGIVSFLVRPLQLDTIFRKLRYWGETPFRRLAKMGQSVQD